MREFQSRLAIEEAYQSPLSRVSLAGSDSRVLEARIRWLSHEGVATVAMRVVSPGLADSRPGFVTIRRRG